MAEFADEEEKSIANPTISENQIQSEKKLVIFTLKLRKNKNEKYIFLFS